MSQLERAMQAAVARKMAATGTTETGQPEVIYSSGEFEDRAVFSGFDIGHDELIGTSMAVGDFYAQNARIIGLRALFVSCWCDGLLTGLIFHTLPSESLAPDISDDIGPGGCVCPHCGGRINSGEGDELQ